MNALGIALDSIWTHRLRSALTALGIVIGVFAVVTLTSLGAGVRSYVTSQFKQTGTGLGLTVSQKIVQDHGGELTIQSTVGVGTVATVILPLEHPALA